MNTCSACGGEVRLRAVRVSFNRKRGVAHWIEHVPKSDCRAADEFATTTWKTDKPPKPWQLLVVRWNQENSADSGELADGMCE